MSAKPLTGQHGSAGSQPAAVPASLAAAPDRSRRLQDWVNRELQALLDLEDVSIVRSFVMSLATAHGLHKLQTGPSTQQPLQLQQQQQSQQQQQQQQQGSSVWGETAIAALQPFLHDRTAHFWHELK